MKKLMIILIILIMPISVFASSKTDDTNKSKIVACSYEQKTASGGTHQITIYYYNYAGSTEWEIYYKEAGGKSKTKGPDNFSKIFSTSGTPNVYMPDDVKTALSNYNSDDTAFACPKNGYLDTAYWNEFCFDNDGVWCANKFKNDWSTNFGTNDKNYAGNEKTGDMLEDYADDLSDNMANGITGEDVVNGTTNDKIQQNVNEVTNEHFNTENSGELPSGVSVGINEKQDTISEQPKSNINETISEYKEKITQLCSNGSISEEECNDIINKLENYDEDKLFQEIWTNNFALSPIIIDINDCTTLLGDPSVDGTPAFYLVVAFSVIKYVTIIILVVMTILDFAGAVASQDNDILKKTFTKTITRAVLCVVIFVLPTIIEFIMQYASDTANALCGIN